MTSRLVVAMALAMAACSPKPAFEPAWRAEARLTAGEVRVLPVISMVDHIAVNRDTFLGREIPWAREAVRRERTEQLRELPVRVGLALPGAVNGELGTAWEGQFRAGPFPVGGFDRVRARLQGGLGIDNALSDVARRVPAEATLFSWVEGLDGKPLSAQSFPGFVIDTPRGPVHVDHDDEPYLVEVDVGMALVTRDGEVVLRYDDRFQTILSGYCNPDVAARDLAGSLAAEVAKVWAIDPRLALN